MLQGGACIDVKEIAIIEILIQAMDGELREMPSEIGATTKMLRKYVETHSSSYFELAKESFVDIDCSLRVKIKDRATGIALASSQSPPSLGVMTRTVSPAIAAASKPVYGWMLRERP